MFQEIGKNRNEMASFQAFLKEILKELQNPLKMHFQLSRVLVHVELHDRL